MSKLIHLTAIAVVSTLGLSAAPSAVASPDTVSRTVSLRGLDLSDEHDAGVALRRVMRAASAVCDPSYGTNPTYRWTSSYRSCVRDAAGNAVARANSRVMTALYEGGAVKSQIAYAPSPRR